MKFHTCLLPTRPRIWREGLGSRASASLDPGFMLTQQQIPSKNSSSVQISICTGSQEVPHRTEQPVRGMYATRRLRNASLQQVPRRVWRRDGRTHTCSISPRGPPHPWGVHRARMFSEQLCSVLYMHPLVRSSDPTGGCVMHPCFADEEIEPKGALAATCPRRRPRPASPLLRQRTLGISSEPCRPGTLCAWF